MIGVTGQDGDCLENEIRIKNLELGPLKAFRIIFKNFTNVEGYWSQAIGLVQKIYLEKYRIQILASLHALMLLTFWILSGARASGTESEDNGIFSILVFHLIWIGSGASTYILIEKCNPDDDIPPN